MVTACRRTSARPYLEQAYLARRLSDHSSLEVMNWLKAYGQISEADAFRLQSLHDQPVAATAPDRDQEADTIQVSAALPQVPTPTTPGSLDIAVTITNRSREPLTVPRTMDAFIETRVQFQQDGLLTLQLPAEAGTGVVAPGARSGECARPQRG